MKALVQVQKTTILQLDAEESEWLKGYLQNSLVSPEDEEEIDKDMRGRFWKALSAQPSSKELVINDGNNPDET